MQKTKKILCFILSLVLIIVSIPFASAEDKENYPLIILPGYSSSNLYIQKDDGSKEKIWGLEVYTSGGDKSVSHTISILNNFIKGFSELSKGRYDYIRDYCTPAIETVLNNLAIDGSGKSVNNVVLEYDNTAEGSRVSNPNHEKMNGIAQYMTGAYDEDNMYVYASDFRLGAIGNAKRIHDLIEDVLKTTGSKKVNIIAQSYGGQLCATYLSIFKDEVKDYVNQVVMTVPAIGGACLAYDAFADKMEFDEEKIAEFAEQMSGINSDIHWILMNEPVELIDEFVHAVMPVVIKYIKNWESLWDFIPYEYYQSLIDKLLDPVENADIINETTEFHEKYMKNFAENLQYVKKSGVGITIIAGTGTNSVTGMKVNSDGIISVNSSTGATCAPWGERFSDGYSTVNTQCKDLSHNHLSPSMEIDASTCYLPENTWFCDGMFHGQENRDKFSLSLIYRQLTSESPVTDVHEDPEYPQFHAFEAPSLAVTAYFDNSTEGYVSSEDKNLIVKNISEETVRIEGITVQGEDVKLKNATGTYIFPGKTAKIRIKNEIPNVSKKRISVTVTYTMRSNTATPLGERTLDFTIMNGEPVSYDASNPYSPADFPADVNDKVKSSPFARFFQMLKVFFNNLFNVFDRIGNMAGSISNHVKEKSAC